MAGFGSIPFGSGSYGLGVLVSAPIAGTKPLVDPATGRASGSRAIDPRTGDYVFDGVQIVGMDDVRQLVLLRLKTTSGTAGVQSLGNTLKSIDRITSNIARRVDSILRRAVADIVAQGLIEVLSVDVDVVRPGVVFARFRWRNLITGLDDTESVPVTG